ncbi:MAG: zinc-binding dehydrogenase [Gammaproteobacteria bacterium]|nr:zinc-binding dehydrogenase [Gammaproteobacteria bacterium]MBI5618301.1 zinc-binding dehydrogenase [Gammaproteobacteria bacterium]
MRAAVMRNRELKLVELPVPEPGPGEVLVKTLACGICGSDLHALAHSEKLVDGARRSGGPFVMDLARDVVMGHEFCAEIVDYGPACKAALPVGSRVCALPVLIRGTLLETIGYSNEHPGGYGEYMRVMEDLMVPVPGDLATAHAALTEPMAVGLHAVAKARLEKHDVPLVVGCGPVGLAVIAALKLAGIGPVVAADFAPGRRALAERMGADVVIDPGAGSPYAGWREAAVWPDPARAPTLPPWLPGPALRPAVIFECVGVPGMIQQVMAGAPPGARIVIVGVCMEHDRIEPVFGINKELNLQFVLGYTKEEFFASVGHIADGRLPVAPLVTGRVGIEGVADAFAALGEPGNHAKILVEPWHA